MSELGKTHHPRTEEVELALGAFARRVALDPGDVVRMRQLMKAFELYPAGLNVSSLGPTPRLKWIVTGWACEVRVLPDSRRQIFSFLLPGDVLLARPIHAKRPCSVVALTRLECVDVDQLLASATEGPRARLADAMATAADINEERKFEHIVRLGQHSAAERVVHLMLDLRDRLAEVGLVRGDTFRLPLTQEHLADALGLSVVHVNRTLRALRTKGLLEIRFGGVTLLHRQQLASIAGRAQPPR